MFERKLAKNGGITKDLPPPCVTTFIQGKGKCVDSNCLLDHKLDFKRISKGVCFNEFFTKGSCGDESHCRFEHRIPEELRYDVSYYEAVQRKWNSLKKKNLPSYQRK